MLVSPLLNFASPYLFGAAVGTATCLGLVMALNTRNPDTSHVAIRLAKCIGKVAIPVLLGCYLGGYPGIVGAAALCYWYWKRNDQAQITNESERPPTPPIEDETMTPEAWQQFQEQLSQASTHEDKLKIVLEQLPKVPKTTDRSIIKGLLVTAFAALCAIPQGDLKSETTEELRASIRQQLGPRKDIHLLYALKLAVRFASFDADCCRIMLEHITQQLKQRQVKPEVDTLEAVTDLVSALQVHPQSEQGQPLHQPTLALAQCVKNLLSRRKPEPTTEPANSTSEAFLRA